MLTDTRTGRNRPAIRRSAVLAPLAVLAGVTLTACDEASDAALALGDSATTDFYSLDAGQRQGEGTVAVTDVRKGSIDDLTAGGFELDDAQSATTPYYVDVTYTNDGEARVDLREPSAVDADGEFLPSLTVIESAGAPVFEPCPRIPQFLAAGRTAEGCAIVLVPTGVDLDRISYLPDASEDFLYWDADLA